jgi:hypothetical protein
MDSVDNEQYNRLKEYKKSIQGEGFYIEYDNIEKFHSLVSKHLQLLINDKKNNIFGTNSQENLEIYETNKTEKNDLLEYLTDTAKFILKEHLSILQGHL